MLLQERFLGDRRPSTSREYSYVAAESPTALDPEVTEHQQCAKSKLTSSAGQQSPLPHLRECLCMMLHASLQMHQHS